MPTRLYKLSELAQLVGGQVDGDAATEIRGVAGIREAKRGDITFVANPKYAEFVMTTQASAVIGSYELEAPTPTIRTEDPYFAYLKVLNLFAQEHAVRYPREIHPAAVIDPSAEIGENVSLGPFCQVGRGARIGTNTTILCGSFIGELAEVGCDCMLYANVVVREGCRIGDRVI
ncbi:MAG: UDP-3-O-(3-hydroxymyristoyl)glucosamine N-acyltransferase, partial [Candidatus Krumholzibacteriota bacterium]|nr:UDP-3-O-(3-hydroxymyristoyl)glucosamine N-acyltransferase [Candidatus Krumholzibacteriota bacterium]